MALTDKLTAIADAIRAKTGKEAEMTLAEMPSEISNIQTGSNIPDGTEVTFGYENGAPVEREEAYAISCTELNELGKIVQGVANTASLLTIADMNYWLSRAKFIPQAYANTEIPATSQRLLVGAIGELQEA